jgi:hypothetical protein
MLSARRKSDGLIVTAYSESKAHGPFYCPVCNDEVALKTGRNRVNHFAHIDPLACRYAENESEAHRRCKMEIFEVLQKLPNVEKAALERPLGTNRPDVSAYISGVPVSAGQYDANGQMLKQEMFAYPKFTPCHGFYLARNDARPDSVSDQNNVSAPIPPIWDAWFNEKVTYDPASGVVEYFMNDLKEGSFNVGVLPQTDLPTMTMFFTSWGWYTGHDQLFRNLDVTQASDTN